MAKYTLKKFLNIRNVGIIILVLLRIFDTRHRQLNSTFIDYISINTNQGKYYPTIVIQNI